MFGFVLFGASFDIFAFDILRIVLGLLFFFGGLALMLDFLSRVLVYFIGFCCGLAALGKGPDVFQQKLEKMKKALEALNPK